MNKRLFGVLLSWPNTVETCVRIDAIFVLIPETFDPIGATYGQMRASVNEIFVSSEKTGTKTLHEQNCAPTAETSAATRVIFTRIVGI